MVSKRWYYTIPLRLRSVFRRKDVEQELTEEFEYHLEQQIEQNLSKGMSPEEARYMALRVMGGIEQRKEQCREKRGVNIIDHLRQDLDYGVRMLRRNPGFTVVAILTLALGIGANTAIFSAENAVLFRVLPYNQPQNLVQIFQTYYPQRRYRMPVAPANFMDWQAENKSFESFTAYKLTSFNLTGDNNPERIRGALVLTNTFDVLGINPILGRTFQTGEDKTTSESLAVLSYNLWQRRFAASREVIGRTIKANNNQYTIIGVMPPDFRFPIGWISSDVDMWTPLTLSATELNNRKDISLDVIARLRPGVKAEQAQANLQVLTRRLEQLYPETNKDWGANVMSLGDRGVAGYGSLFLFLSLAVAMVLLIACANVANLLLARGIERQKELTIRAALGAGRWRLIRQLLTEGILLSSLAGLCSVVLAYYGIKVLAAIAPANNLPELKQVSLNGRVLAFSVGLSVLTGLLFSLFPALTLSRFSLRDALQEGGRGSSDSLRRSRLKTILVVAELALTVSLLLCAGTLIKSFHSYMSRDPGFDPANVVTMRIALPIEKYKSSDQWTAFFERIQQETKSIPGVVSVCIADGAPMEDGGDVYEYNIVGRPPRNLNRNVIGGYFRITPEYFRTAGIRFLKGRTIDASDVEGSARVVVVNEAFVKREFPDKDPIGEKISLTGDVNKSVGGGSDKQPLEIVGVVANTKEYTLYLGTPAMMYVPFRQEPARAMSLVVKTATEPTSLLPEIRSRIVQIDPDLPVYNIRTLEQIFSNNHSLLRFNTLLMTMFASVALILALIGTYGVISYSVSQSTKEFGIRLALGSQPGAIFKLVLGRGALLGVTGLGLGLAASFPAIKLLAQSLKESMDLNLIGNGVYLSAVICGAMLLVALLACFIPARRATKVDPMVALRYE